MYYFNKRSNNLFEHDGVSSVAVHKPKIGFPLVFSLDAANK